MNVRETIERKRDGYDLPADAITSVVSGYSSGSISDAEMAALLMAIYLHSMTASETYALTQAMAGSGERLDLSTIPGVTVDKHSTGGVGDKTTLIVAPLVASLGVPVPKMSGRALGHTGGTIDKLECIPGLTTDLPPDRFIRQITEIGLAIAAQSDRLAPADKKIYALRDLTATVESIPLIASSVMSKKLAAGAQAIVLDVKVGSGAFMADLEQARSLANLMVEIGRLAGRRMAALITTMDQPIGRAIGDGLELIEAVETLRGEGPEDLIELCIELAAWMLVLGDRERDLVKARSLALETLHGGRALGILKEMVRAQNGDDTFLDNPASLLEKAVKIPLESPADGFIAAIDSRVIGLLIRALKVDAGDEKHLCGLFLDKKVSDPVKRGEKLATLYSCARSQLDKYVPASVSAFTIIPEKTVLPSLVVDTIVS